MDCPSEEQTIRMKLEPYKEEKQLSFDIPTRNLEVYHTEEVDKVHQAISELKLYDRLENIKDKDSSSAKAPVKPSLCVPTPTPAIVLSPIEMISKILYDCTVDSLLPSIPFASGS